MNTSFRLTLGTHIFPTSLGKPDPIKAEVAEKNKDLSTRDQRGTDDGFAEKDGRKDGYFTVLEIQNLRRNDDKTVYGGDKNMLT